jgi:ABC-type sugar transport system ATPase subunit
MQTNNIIEMKGIYKSFGGLHALSNVNLDLRYNEILGLVGDNAAGKSTLMKILTGAYKADQGQIYFEGIKLDIKDPHDSRATGIEMIYQDLSLCPNLSISDNLFMEKEMYKSWFCGLIKTIDRKKEAKESFRVLSALKINIEDTTKKVEELSGGQQQAVAIGRATHFSPKVIIMDEPTASLAVKEIDQVLDLMRRLRNQGISIIFITHRLQDIFEIVDRVMILRGGENVGVFNIQEVSREDVVRMMFLSHDLENAEKEKKKH